MQFKNVSEIRSEQVEFLKDLMNGFNFYKRIKRPKRELNYKDEDLYQLLMGNKNKTVNDIFLQTSKDKDDEEI